MLTVSAAVIAGDDEVKDSEPGSATGSLLAVTVAYHPLGARRAGVLAARRGGDSGPSAEGPHAVGH